MSRERSTAGNNPHGFLLHSRIAGRALGRRETIELIASGGGAIIDPDDPSLVVEIPIADPNTLEVLTFEQPAAEGELLLETVGG